MKNVRTRLLTTAAIMALTGSAYAADMGLPAKAPLPAPIPYANWQGFYIGGSIGAARLNTTGNQTANATDGAYGTCAASEGTVQGIASCSTSATGFTAGVQVGYDWQTRYFVYGVVADWTWTNLSHTVTNHLSSHPFFRAKVDWLASFRGRMGLAVDDTLVYFTGGLALADIKSGTGQTGDCPSYCYANDISTTRAGWVAGLGTEHKFNQNWSVFAEFLYYDFGRVSASGSSPNNTVSYSTEFTHEIMQGKVGVNYRF
jgi:outer membrane immunogenic protein